MGHRMFLGKPWPYKWTEITDDQMLAFNNTMHILVKIHVIIL